MIHNNNSNEQYLTYELSSFRAINMDRIILKTFDTSVIVRKTLFSLTSSYENDAVNTTVCFHTLKIFLVHKVYVQYVYQ